jgi:hypothetical protein
MSRKKPEETQSVLATLPENPSASVDVVSSTEAIVESVSETKATIDGVFIVDGRMAVCDTEADAIAIHRACFQIDAVEVLAGDRHPTPGERVLHYRGPDRVPYYGRFE